MRAPDKGVLLITHYQRLLDYVKPDRVHVLSAGTDRALGRARAGARARARRLCGGGGMTAPFPTRKLEACRYADIDALASVWEQFARAAERVEIAAQQKLQQIWLPSGEDVDRCAASRSRSKRARRRAFSRSTPRRDYGRIELDVTLAEGADFALYGANIGGGNSTTRDRHHASGTSAPARRSRQTDPQRARRQGDRHPISARSRSRAAPADRRRAVGQGDAARPRRDRQLQARARDFRRRREVRARRDGRRAGREPTVLRRSRGLDPASARALLLEGFVMRLVGRRRRTATRSPKPRATRCGGSCMNVADPHQLGARRARPVPGDRRLALSRQRRDRAKAAGGDRRHHQRLCARLCDRASRRLRALGER